MTLVKNHRQNRLPVFSSVFPELFVGLEQSAFKNGLPLVNISENEKGFYLELSVPGFSKEEINLQLHEETLVIRGEKTSVSDESAERRFSRKEFTQKNFKRSFTVPEQVELEKIEAKVENGILSIMLPKKETQEKHSRKIEIL